MKKGCLLVALIIVAVFAGFVAWVAHRTEVITGTHHIDTLRALEQKTSFRWPPGTMLLEASRTWTTGENWYWAVLRMTKRSATDILARPPFRREHSSASDSRIRSPASVNELRLWHPERARTFLANEVGYEVPFQPGDTDWLGSGEDHEGGYRDYDFAVLADLGEAGAATVYALWIVEYGSAEEKAQHDKEAAESDQRR